jgi:putative peptidoglycan lipid II flippase
MTEGPTAPASGASKSVTRSTTVMAVGTSLSRLTGVVRTAAVAYALGSLFLADAYNLANTIPNIVTDIVLGGIVSATFIPVFVERLSTRDENEAWEAISAVTSVTLVVIAGATVIFMMLSPLLIDAMTALNHSPGAGQSRHVATDLLILFVPQLACYGVISLATALLNTRRRFGAPMFAPIANNVVVIVVLFWFGTSVRHRSLAGVASHRGQLILLGLGTTIGVVAQAALLVPSLRRAGLLLRWRPDIHHEAVRTVLRLSSWTFGLVVANQLALLVVLVMSEKVGAGAVSAYTYAYAFFQFPYGIVAVSIMAATAPELTSHWSTGDIVAFRRRMTVGLRAMLAIIVPAAAGLIVLARPAVALLLGHGASTTARTVPTATSLAMLALGLPGFCVFLYAIRVFQSVQDLRSAFWLYVVENGINIVLAVALAGPLGVRGIALSIAIAYTAAAAVAIERLRTHVTSIDTRVLAKPLGGVLVASAALVVAAALASNVTASQHGLGLLVRVVLGVAAGAVAYFLAAALLAALRARRTRRTPGIGQGPPAGTSDGGRGGPEPDTREAAHLPDSAGGSSRTRRRGAHSRGASGGPGLRDLWGRSRARAPSPPEPLPPAGRPPLRPPRLGPTRRPDPGGAGRGKLDS